MLTVSYFTISSTGGTRTHIIPPYESGASTSSVHRAVFAFFYPSQYILSFLVCQMPPLHNLINVTVASDTDVVLKGANLNTWTGYVHTGWMGLEPTIAAVTVLCINRLCYHPNEAPREGIEPPTF